MNTVMGGETEYAISARSADGKVIDQPILLRRLFEHVRPALPYTTASARGKFLSNGGLLYLDAGLHLEWATPEVTSPFEVVRYLEAGDRIVLGLAASFAAASDVGDIFCSRANVDYVSGTLWAAHESYMHAANPEDLPASLVPLLVSRVIFGAGGLDYGALAPRFTLSPRAHFITQLMDRDSQHVRPLFHAKDEPLGTAHRLHVACAESLCSHTANVLRFGTTALVLALIERGVSPGAPVSLVAPIVSLQRFAADPDLRVSVRLDAGGRATALDIQRHYLLLVERRLDQVRYPWAEEVCTLWRRTLDQLESGDPEVGAVLDWAIKRRVFTRCLERHGLSWIAARAWEPTLRRLRRNYGREVRDARRFDLARVLAPNLWMRAHMDRLTPELERRGLSWAQLPALAAARDELYELDGKFAALDDAGVFNTLDRAGVLRHRVRHLDVADAMQHPPADTRARIRGTVVQRLSAEGRSYGAEWTSVYDRDQRRELDLRNPFETEERWHDVPLLAEPLPQPFS